MNAYYIANPEHMDAVYGSGQIVCVDAREVRRLAREWGMDAEDLFPQFHPATDDEIAEYGTYTTPLTLAQYAELFAEAVATDDPTAYLSDWALSSMWGDPADRCEIPDSRIAFLRHLWEASGWSVSEICYHARITMVELSQISLVPYRTLQRWAADSEKFAARDRYYLLHLLGLLPKL